jgi:hypothetical protein
MYKPNNTTEPNYNKALSATAHGAFGHNFLPQGITKHPLKISGLEYLRHLRHHLAVKTVPMHPPPFQGASIEHHNSVSIQQRSHLE